MGNYQQFSLKDSSIMSILCQNHNQSYLWYLMHFIRTINAKYFQHIYVNISLK